MTTVYSELVDVVFRNLIVSLKRCELTFSSLKNANLEFAFSFSSSIRSNSGPNCLTLEATALIKSAEESETVARYRSFSEAGFLFGCGDRDRDETEKLRLRLRPLLRLSRPRSGLRLLEGERVRDLCLLRAGDLERESDLDLDLSLFSSRRCGFGERERERPRLWPKLRSIDQLCDIVDRP